MFSTPALATAVKTMQLVKRLALRDWLLYCSHTYDEPEEKFINSWIKAQRREHAEARAWSSPIEPGFYELGGES